MRSDSSGKQIKLGMVLSYINIGIGNLIPLFYTPVMLSLLGQNEYGLYKIASSTTSYLSLISFGIGSAVTRYLIKANTEGGKRAEENMFGLFNLIFHVIAILTLIVGSVITLNLGLLYSSSLTATELNRMKILVFLMVINTAVGFSATSYNTVVSTHERFVFVQCINILSTIGTPILNLIVLFCGYKSIGMATASLAINIFIRILYVFYVRCSLKIRPRYDNLPWKILREVLTFSFWVFISNIVGQMFSATDTIIIGATPALATTGAAVYSIGSTFPSIMFSLAQVTPSLFSPMANRMVFSGSTDDELTELVIKVGRLQAYVVALVCFGFIAFGRPFLDFYAGEGYEEAYWVAVIIMIPDCIPLVQSVAHSIIQAKNMHQFRSKVYLCIATLNVIGTLVLVRNYGIIGAAIPTGITYFLGHGLIMNWYYWKRVHLNIPKFWKEVCPIFIVSAVICVMSLFTSKWIDFYDIKNLIIGIVGYTVIYAILIWHFIMNNYEKDIIIRTAKRVISFHNNKIH